jgi:NAD(P)-dependent dehydrogenase (short-subunit alcohol dehydrogenase family)
MSSFRFDRHRAAVIGAGGAIGAAVCRAYARAGASVFALDLELEAAQRAIAGLEGDHAATHIDVTDVASVNIAAGEAGFVDSVVYSVGIAFTTDVTELDWSSYRKLMAVNLDGAFYVGAAFGRPMLEAGRTGSFVFVSSTAGQRGEGGAAAYCASKFALIGFAESFAAELTGAGIRVNVVCPGNVDSPLLRSISAAVAVREGSSSQTVLDRFAHEGAAERLVEPAEVAETVVWLCSPLAAAITGATVRVDAGQLLG